MFGERRRQSVTGSEPAADEEDDINTPQRGSRRRFGGISRKATVAVIIFSLVAVEPALAQSAVCDATGLPQMISGFFQLTSGIGLIGAVVVWQANSLAEMFTLDRDQINTLKRYRQRALKSALVLVILGPLYSVAGAMMGLPLAACVDLTPL